MSEDQKDIEAQNSSPELSRDKPDIESVLGSLSEEKREEIIEIAMSYRGPVMPPQLLRDIEDIIPGGADRVLQLSEKEQAHRHSIVTHQTEASVWQIKASLMFGVASFIFLVLGILYCSIHDSISGVVALGGIGAFGVITHIIRLPQKNEKLPVAKNTNAGKK